MAQMLPKLVQSASGKSYDSSSPQGKMIVNSPNYKNPFDKKSSALAPMDPSGSGLAASGAASPMSPMESAMAVFQSMADSLESIKESAISLVMASEGDARGDALADANVTDPEAGVVDTSGTGQDTGGKEDKPSRMPSLKKLGLTLLIAGVIFFAEKLKPILAKVLEGFKFIYNILKTSFLAVFDYVKEFFNDPVGTLKKSLDAVLDGLASLGAWIWDKGIKPVWDWITGLFDSGAGAVIKEKFLAVAGVFTSIGGWIWDNAIKPVWDWVSGIFGFGEDDETDAEKESFSLTSFISDKFLAIKEWFVKKLSFDFPDLGLGDKLMSIGDMILNFVGGMLPNPNKWLGKAIYKLPGTKGLKAAAEMFQAGGSIEGGVLTMPSEKTPMGDNASTLANQTAQMNASTGGVVILDKSVKTSNTNTTSDTYNQQELSSDHNESSGSWWSRVDLTPWN